MPPLYPDRDLVEGSILAVIPLEVEDREALAEAITHEIVDLRNWVKLGAPTASIGVTGVPFIAANDSEDVTLAIGGGTQGAAVLVGSAPLLGALTHEVLSHTATAATVRVTNTGLLPLLANQVSVVAVSARDYVPA